MTGGETAPVASKRARGDRGAPRASLSLHPWQPYPAPGRIVSAGPAAHFYFSRARDEAPEPLHVAFAIHRIVHSSHHRTPSRQLAGATHPAAAVGAPTGLALSEVFGHQNTALLAPTVFAFSGLRRILCTGDTRGEQESRLRVGGVARTGEPAFARRSLRSRLRRAAFACRHGRRLVPEVGIEPTRAVKPTGF